MALGASKSRIKGDKKYQKVGETRETNSRTGKVLEPKGSTSGGIEAAIAKATGGIIVVDSTQVNSTVPIQEFQTLRLQQLRRRTVGAPISLQGTRMSKEG